MGVKSLLPQIPKPEYTTTKKLKNMRLAIDGHCILHRCCMFAAKSILINDDITSVVKYLVNYLEELLQYANPKSILIFDGGCLQSKDNTMEMRTSNRKNHLEQAKQLIKQGKSPGDHLMKAFTINSNQLSRIIQQLSDIFPQLTIFLSPCEADAQLAFLINTGMADAVVTIDSDLLLYGIQTAIFKFDQKTKEIDLYKSDQVYQQKLLNKDNIYLQKLAVLAGCDYVPNLKGVGWVKIWKQMEESSGNVLQCITSLMNLPNIQLPDNYLSINQIVQDIVRALLTFKYHVIFDPIQQIFRSISPIIDEDIPLIQIIGGDFFGVENHDVSYCVNFAAGVEVNESQESVIQKLQEFKIRYSGVVNAYPVTESVFKLLKIQKFDLGIISGDGFSFDLNSNCKEDVK